MPHWKKSNNPLNKIQSVNPVVGCTIGCDYCYAERFCKRYALSDNFRVPVFHEERLYLLYSKKPKSFFLTTMSDLSMWKPEWIEKTFKAIRENPQHEYLFMTKRPKHLDMDIELDNVWMACTVTKKEDVHRIAELQEHVRCQHYMVCFEPLHGDVGELDLSGIESVIIGAETGGRRLKILPRERWILNISRQATEQGVLVAMKDSIEPYIDPEDVRRELPYQLVGLTRKYISDRSEEDNDDMY